MVAEHSEYSPSSQHVVPVSHRPLATAYGSLLKELAEALERDFAWPSPEAGFACFVFHQAGETGPVPGPAALAWPSTDRLLHAPSLAAGGYWLACGEGSSIRGPWLDGVQRLSTREAFPSDRQSFAYRPIEFLGLALGVAACKEAASTLEVWIKGVLDRIRRDPAADLWSGCMRRAAELALGLPSPAPVADVSAATLEELALCRWLPTALAKADAAREIDEALLRRALFEACDGSDLAKNAVLYQALRSAVGDTIESEIEKHWQVGRRQRDAEALITTLCRRFHVYAQQLLDRHDKRGTVQIVDEYDVQDLMHALLKLHFEDVRPEEVTPSMAGKSGRMDFLLKAERVAVETKMTRKGLDQKAVGDELIVDMKRYRTHPDYRTLVCFVYDPGGYCHAPAALENDLSGQDGDFRTIVIVCPRGM